jgi:hypothetical protein
VREYGFAADRLAPQRPASHQRATQPDSVPGHAAGHQHAAPAQAPVRPRTWQLTATPPSRGQRRPVRMPVQASQPGQDQAQLSEPISLRSPHCGHSPYRARTSNTATAAHHFPGALSQSPEHTRPVHETLRRNCSGVSSSRPVTRARNCAAGTKSSPGCPVAFSRATA